MRYAAAILVLGVGLSAVMPAAFADERESREVSLPAVTAQMQPGDPGTIAGPTANPNQFDDKGHDRN